MHVSFFLHTHSSHISYPSHTHTYAFPLVDAYLHATPQTAYEYNSITLFPPEQLGDGKTKCVQDKINATTDRPTCRTNERLTVTVWLEICIWAKQKRWHSLPLILLSLLLHVTRSPTCTQWKYIKRNISKILFNQYLRTAFVHHACIHERAFGFSFWVSETGERRALRRLKCKISICKSVSVLIDWK